MIVITGATGKTGSVVADILIANGYKVRVVGRDAGRLKGFTAKGAEAAVGDMGETGFLTKNAIAKGDFFHMYELLG